MHTPEAVGSRDEVCPDFVVEFIARTEFHTQVLRKVRHDLSVGARFVCVVDAGDGTTSVFVGRSQESAPVETPPRPCHAKVPGGDKPRRSPESRREL